MILFLCMPKEKVSKKKRQLTKRATPEVFFRDRQELAPTRKPTQSSDILPVFRSKALVRLTPFFVERRLRRQSIYWPMTTLCEVPDFPPFLRRAAIPQDSETVFRSKALVRLTPFFVERRLRRQSIYWPMTTLCEVPDFPPFLRRAVALRLCERRLSRKAKRRGCVTHFLSSSN